MGDWCYNSLPVTTLFFFQEGEVFFPKLNFFSNQRHSREYHERSVLRIDLFLLRFTHRGCVIRA